MKEKIYVLVSWQLWFLALLITSSDQLFSQDVPIVNHSINSSGQILIDVESSDEVYNVLQARLNADSDDYITVSITPGQDGINQISEQLAALPIDHYRVLQIPISQPTDLDGDGMDDMEEYNNIPFTSPFNSAPSIHPSDGFLSIDSIGTFNQLSILKEYIQFSEFLNGLRFVKYLINDFDSDHPRVYFIESNKHDLHSDFANVVGEESLGDNVKKGQIIYHPTSISNNGRLGNYAFNYSNGKGQEFEVVQRTYEILAANMPFLQNNFSYFITERSQEAYERDMELYANSRVHLLFEADLYGDVDYWGLNFAEGYGLFKKADLEEIPGPREIVLYETLPNELPRVGGVISSVIQTPLSHVNLRAIQNNIPNAYIKDPLLVDSISQLLNKNIYFKVEQDKYIIREASTEEVNEWFQNIRPERTQFPPLNLSYTNILPLEEIRFEMYDAFGAKTANVATMQTFGFPEGTVPDGYGIPFFYYQEFMRFNNLHEDVKNFVSDEEFQNDRNKRNSILSSFRDKIKSSEMPKWMMDELEKMQKSFPEGTSIRCRSSTNNEDLPDFNGAGLYTSKTQHPEEGHISKSIKQVFASLWNLRAFDEREFYRIDHFRTSMGVLCHPNFEDELANGVGVSVDPLYNTDKTFYLNTQVGEELITNPGANSIPEEILLERFPINSNKYIVIQRSNLSEGEDLIMNDEQLEDMRQFLIVIHDRFQQLYNAEGNDDFAMDIEYKINSEGQLIIKQARPWVNSTIDGEELDSPNVGLYDFKLFPNPASDDLYINTTARQFKNVVIYDSSGSLISKIDLNNDLVKINISSWPPGIYYVMANDHSDKLPKTKILFKR